MKTNTNILRIIVVSFTCWFWTNVADAAITYYVRVDGGTQTQCTGKADAAYPGSGSGKSCAFKHPFYAIAPIGNNPSKMVGGDTLIIDGSADAQYMIGYGAPNTTDTTKCHQNWPWDCIMRPVPSGPDATHPTRILGKGWDKGCTTPPELWGTERVENVINLTGSDNVQIQCLEITDHSDCQDFGPKPCDHGTFSFGKWAKNGIYSADSENVLIKNVNIHGMAYRGIHAGRLRDWTVEDTKIVANSFVGWDGDIGKGVSANKGTMTFNNVSILFNGCGEKYPTAAPFNCYSQDQGGYGDGLGTEVTGAHWVFNDSDISHNVSDGLDLLYHNNNGSVTIQRSRFEGNAGNQVKVGTNTKIENSIIVGNCSYFNNKEFTWQSTTFNNCRAGGNAIAFDFAPGMSASIKNSSVVANNGDVIIQTSGASCSGDEEVFSRNNIFVGAKEFHSPTENSALYWASGASGNGDGSCGSVSLDNDYSLIWQTKFVVSDCLNSPHSKCVDPKLTQSPVTYYAGDLYNAKLKETSPAITAALKISGISSLDYAEVERGTIWDIGALEYAAAGAPPTGPDPSACGNGVLDPGEQCDGTNVFGQICQDLGYAGGLLTCNSTCQLNTVGCSYCWVP